MIKMMTSICRKPGMTHAEYLAYVQHVHGAGAKVLPAHSFLLYATEMLISEQP